MIESTEDSYDHSGFTYFYYETLRKRSLAYIVWLGVAILLAWYAYSSTRDTSTYSMGGQICVYYLVLLVHVIKRIKGGGKGVVLSFDFIILLFYTLFHMGYVTLYYFNIVPYIDIVFFFSSTVPDALFVTNLGLIGFILGYEMVGRGGEDVVPSYVEPNHMFGIIGVLFMILAFIMHFLGLYLLGWDLISQYGYQAISASYRYANQFTVLLLRKSVMVMVLGEVLYLSYSTLKYNKLFNSKIAMTLIISFMVLMLIEGDRGPIVQLTIPILFIYHYLIKPVKIRYLILLFFFLLFLFNVISFTRQYGMDPSKMVKEYLETKDRDERTAWYMPLVETGGSFKTVVITCKAVPDHEPYWYGASWRDAGFHMIPFFQRLALSRGWSRQAPARWVTDTYFGTSTAGMGFTAAAEGYLNWGFPGALAELMIIGLLVRLLTIQFCKKPTMVRLFFMFGCIAPIITTIRAEFNVATGTISIVIILCLLFKMLLPDVQKEYYYE